MQRTNLQNFFLLTILSLGFLGWVAVAPANADDAASVREKLRLLPLPTQGGQCSAAAGASKTSVEDLRTALLLSQLAATANAEQQATATTDGVLNGRGYNYGPDPDTFDFAVIQRELELQRQSESK